MIRMPGPTGVGQTGGVGQSLPANVESAVMKVDAKHHLGNIPDLQYRNIESSKHHKDGSWEVKVASHHTSIMGPIPGHEKPFDVATYLFKDGKVSVKAHKAATPTKSQLENVLGTYNFHNMVKWQKTVQPGITFSKAIVLHDHRMVDGDKLTAHLVKGSNHLVVFESEGGRKPGVTFTTPLRWDVLPK